MNVLVDLTFWKYNRAGGVQTVLCSYLRELEYLQSEYDIKFSLLVYQNEYDVLKSRHSGFYLCNLGRRLPFILREGYEFLFLRRKINVKTSDCILSFNYFSYLGLSSNKPLLIMLHDLNHIDIPSTFGRLKVLVRGLLVYLCSRKAVSILTVSEFSAERIRAYYGLNGVHVLYNSLNSDLLLDRQEVDKNKIKELSERNYLLFVGSSHPHKNANLLIDFLTTDLGSEYELIIVGQKKKAYDSLIQYALQKNVGPRVIFTGYVDLADLAAYYQSAYAFVFPSRYEGFGIPPLEAMSFGCPCLCSNAASIPEVCGDAALYFDPDSLSSLTAQVTKLRDNQFLREDLKNRGYERVKVFSWEKSARILCEILQKKYVEKNIASGTSKLI